MPLTARWWIRGVSFNWTFAVERWRWLRGDEIEVVGQPPEPQWGALRIFGEYYLDGGASPVVGLRADDAAVCGLDVEADSAVFLLNSSLHAFVETFRLLDRTLANPEAGPTDLREAARSLDPRAYDQSEWSDLLEVVLDRP